MRALPDGTGYELNEEESTSQLVMWAQMAAPLIIGSDPRKLPRSMIDTCATGDHRGRPGSAGDPGVFALSRPVLGMCTARCCPVAAGVRSCC